MLALHYVHLSADFPNFSPWMDWAKYTDEGWYGDAAIRHFQLGHWYVPGAFNPGVALPVWPLLEAALFHFTGVSLVAARALSVTVFAATLIVAWFLVRRSVREARGGSRVVREQRAGLAAATAVLLLAASPFCYVFSRLAILEPLMVLLTLLALLTAGRVNPDPGSGIAMLWRNRWSIAVLGILLPAMVLTKTTAVFLVPAIAWMLFAALDYKLTSLLRVGSAVAALAVSIWFVYYFGFVRPHYLIDFRYLFSANAYTFITRDTAGSVLMDMLRSGWWVGRPLYLTAGACVLLTILSIRQLRAHPLPVSLLIWILGYAGFLVYHNNLQPRYYYVIAVPLTLLVPAVISELVLPRFRSPLGAILATNALFLLSLAIILPDATQTFYYVRHPEYTFAQAAAKIHDIIITAERRDPRHPWLVLSISGSDLSLMTGLPSICDDFSTLELEDQVKAYHPGWYVAWNELEDDKMDALAPTYKITRVNDQ